MKKKFLVLLTILPALILGGCAIEDGSSSDATDSSSIEPTGNTLSSVLSSFGKNLRNTVTFNFLSESSTPRIEMNFIESGVEYRYTNFSDSFKTSGFVDKDNKSYKWEAGLDTDNKEVLVLGDVLKDSSNNEVETFRDLYYDPSYICSHVEGFLAENFFIPKIKGTTYGTFNLFGIVYESEVGGDDITSESIDENSGTDESEEPSGKVVQDNTEILNILSKSLGVYDTVAALGPDIELNSADFYFSQKGTTFTFHFYYTYKGGYDRLTVTSVITRVGSSSSKLIEDYLA